MKLKKVITGFLSVSIALSVFAVAKNNNDSKVYSDSKISKTQLYNILKKANTITSDYHQKVTVNMVQMFFKNKVMSMDAAYSLKNDYYCQEVKNFSKPSKYFITDYKNTSKAKGYKYDYKNHKYTEASRKEVGALINSKNKNIYMPLSDSSLKIIADNSKVTQKNGSINIETALDSDEQAKIIKDRIAHASGQINSSNIKNIAYTITLKNNKITYFKITQVSQQDDNSMMVEANYSIDNKTQNLKAPV